METTNTNTGGSSSTNPSRGVRWAEMKDAVAAGMPTWETPAEARYNTPSRACAELGYLLEAIETPENGLGDDIELGSRFINWDKPVSEPIDEFEEMLADEEDAKNFHRVLDVAGAVARRLGYMAENFPPEAMEYIRRVVGLKLVERFEALARKDGYE